MSDEKQRLSKILAAAGVASRRAAEELIFEGKVKVNGKKVIVPQTKVDPLTDTITVNGKPIKSKEEKVYFLLNKPVGYICSNKRISRRTKLVIDLFDEIPCRLYTVGRLDRDTDGLLIVTNDGVFAQDLIHPSSNITKEYLVKVNQEPFDNHLKTISAGVEVEGTFVRPVKVKKIRRGTLKITIKEGKKHEVRHLVEAAGLEIVQLTRIRLGHLLLGNLPIGHYRPLTKKEIDEAYKNPQS